MSKLQASKFHLRPWLLAGAALYLLLTLPGLTRYPAVWVDEGWIAEPAWSLAQGGALGNPSHGTKWHFNDRLYWMPPLEFLALAAVFHTPLSPWISGRLVSTAAGLLTLLVLLVWGAQVQAQSSGGTSHAIRGPTGESAFQGFWLLALGLLFTLDPTLWKVHRTIRFEALTGLWSVAAVAVAWNDRLRWRGPLAGLLSGLALLTHPNGALALAAVSGVFFFRPRRGLRSSLVDLAWAGAVTALVCLPEALYLWQDRAAGFADILGQNSPHLAGRSEPVFVQWSREWKRYRAYFALPLLALPLVLWIVAGFAGVRKRAPAPLLWVVAVYAGGLATLPNKTEMYLTLLAPFVFVLAVWAGSRLQRSHLAVAAAAIWILNLAAADGVLLARHRNRSYEAWTAPLRAAVPPHASVAGTFLTWFPLRDHPYLEVHRRRAGDLADARPAYVIWGGSHLREPIFDRLRSELGPFLAAHADTVASSTSPGYGTAMVLRPRWNELPPKTAASWERYGRETPSPTTENPDG